MNKNKILFDKLNQKAQKKLDKMWRATEKDALEKVKENGRCMVVRPTGTGKTCMVARIARNTELTGATLNVLYCFPTHNCKIGAIRAINMFGVDENDTKYGARELSNLLGGNLNSNDKVVGNVRFLSYPKLIRMSKKEIDAFDYDLIVFDEAHRMGGVETYKVCSYIMAKHPEAYYLGLSATPIRADGMDIVDEFYLGVSVFPYDISDAIKDNILKKPLYVYFTYDVISACKDVALAYGVTYGGTQEGKVLNSRIIETSKLIGVDKILKTVVENSYIDKNGQPTENKNKGICKLVDGTYQKYIVFFADIAHIYEKGKDVKKWFKKAFPSSRVYTYTITSKDANNRDMINKVESLKARDNTIDLVFNVDMLCESTHLKDLTGILIYRGTESNPKYNQLIGRALSAGAERPCIIFDIVDNLHRKAVYDLENIRGTVRVGGGRAKGAGNLVPDDEGNLVPYEDMVGGENILDVDEDIDDSIDIEIDDTDNILDIDEDIDDSIDIEIDDMDNIIDLDMVDAATYSNTDNSSILVVGDEEIICDEGISVRDKVIEIYNNIDCLKDDNEIKEDVTEDNYNDKIKADKEKKVKKEYKKRGIIKGENTTNDLSEKLDKEDKSVVDPGIEEIIKGLPGIKSKKQDTWYKNGSRLKKGDMVTSGIVAKTKEFYAKTVGEPVLQQIIEAYYTYQRIWCELHNEDFPFDEEHYLDSHGNIKREELENELPPNVLTDILNQKSVRLEQLVKYITLKGKGKEVKLTDFVNAKGIDKVLRLYEREHKRSIA